MRVAVIGRSTSEGSWVSHIGSAFRELGHDASTYQMRMLGEPRRGRLANLASTVRTDLVSRSPDAIRTLYRGLLRALREARPDLVLTTLGRVTREEVDSWRAAAPGARIALWFPDHLANLGRQQALAAGLDRAYVKDPYLVDRLGSRGGVRELRYLAEGAPSDAATWAAANGDGNRARAVAMVGNVYPSRVRFLEELIVHVPVAIHGRLHNDGVPESVRGHFSGRFLSGTEKYRTFRDARGVLDNLHFAEVESVNYRLFEAAACRGVVLVDDLPQVRRYLEPGREVVTFRSARELGAVLRELTDADLTAIGRAAHARVVAEHLLRHRVAEMLEDLELT